MSIFFLSLGHENAPINFKESLARKAESLFCLTGIHFSAILFFSCQLYNPLDEAAIRTHIPILQKRGVRVIY